ncbi:MAG: hypothetical protein WCW66_02950 [Patescibacteria group bacterium]
MPKKQALKSGIPFITFLIVVTVLVGIWFLNKNDEVTDNTEETVNQSVNQAQAQNANQENINTPKSVENINSNSSVFENSDYNFSYNLSENEAVKEEDSASIYTIYFNSDKLSILDEEMESAVLGGISVVSEKDVNIDGIKGTEIAATSNKDGSQMNLILVKKGGKLFHFQGTETFLTKIKTEFFFED